MRMISYLEIREPALAVQDFRTVTGIDKDVNTWRWLGDALFVDKYEGIIQGTYEKH